VILKLRYGHGVATADLRGLLCRELRPNAPRHPLPAEQLVHDALAGPVAGPPLVELARGRRHAVILVPDATRKAWLPLVLPHVLSCLRAGGVADTGVTVLVACGTHPPVAEAALGELLGPLPGGVRVVQHDARDGAALRPAGTLATGLQVRLAAVLLDADLVVAVSKVQHHYFAGFGGGPKMVFPGVAGYDEIQANHSRVVDLAAPEPRRHPGCEPGVLAGNPVAEEIAAAARLRPPDMALLLVEGVEGRPGWAAAGPLDSVFPAACRQVRAWYESAAGPFDRLVVSARGAPGDDTLIQAHKALDAACRFASPGAEVVFLAACGAGAGSPAMEPFLADPSPAAIIERLRQRYVQYGHTVLRLVEKTAAFRVLTVSELDRALQRRLGLVPVGSLGAVLERWRAETPGEPVGLMPGPPVYPASKVPE
jgi:lactate racemase